MTTTTTTRTTTTTTRTRTRARRRTRSNNNNDDNNDNDDDNDDDDNEDAARSMSCPQVQMKSPSLFPSPDPYRHRRCAKLYNKSEIVLVCQQFYMQLAMIMSWFCRILCQESVGKHCSLPFPCPVAAPQKLPRERGGTSALMSGSLVPGHRGNNHWKPEELVSQTCVKVYSLRVMVYWYIL